MNITCAILHHDPQTIKKLEDFIQQTSFLTLCGKYGHAVEALSAYYEHHIQLFFIGIEHKDTKEYPFCQLLHAPTRVIFLSKDEKAAADCFRLDALDYLLESSAYSVFLEAANKALRWFNLCKPVAQEPAEVVEKASFIYVKSEYRILRIELNEINYIEGFGDYVKIYCRNETKPILSLCSMKNLEQVLPEKEFMRVHRSFIVRKQCISILERGNIIFGDTNIPIGESYRKRFQEYLNQIPILYRSEYFSAGESFADSDVQV